MKTKVTDACISCGLCVDICPEVFEMGDSIAQAKSEEVPAGQEEKVQQAAEECPVDAIEVS